ncbi:hypothetical protein E4U57_006251 [Claviceps arundinis]|uniref:Uncharacterized protein n=2 Tax=Claviceps arundinis TaxID=1623583 RepID=A0ABQ7P258_9HYPO|nr:hypothetical protein E4U57_006251 [Claviceps arundinis]
MSGTTHPNSSTAQNQSNTSVEDELDEFVNADPFERIYLNTKLKDQKDFANCHIWEGNILHNEGCGRQSPLRRAAEKYIDEVASWPASRVLSKLQQRRTMDWGNEAKPASLEFNYYPDFRINTFRIVGQPLHPVVRHSSIVDRYVTISRSHWQAPYSLRHATNTLPFELNERTFRFASGPEKQIWFIVLHPVQADTPEAPESRRSPVERSTIRSDRAQALSTYVNGLLLRPELHALNRTVSLKHWRLVQQTFMEDWPSFVESHGHDKFWKNNHPAFHVLDHGDDTLFETPHNIADIPMEVTLDDNTEVRDTGRIGDISDDEDPEPEGSRPRASGVRNEMPYTGELGLLKQKLEVMYDLSYIDQVSYTIGAVINCLKPPVGETGNQVPMCLLADRSGVCATYGLASTANDCQPAAEFHPLGFHPRYGNFVGSRPPGFIEPLYKILKANVYAQNDCEHVLDFEAFRGYSYAIEDAVRDTVTQGRCGAALTLSPSVRCRSSASVRNNHRQLMQKLPSCRLREAKESIAASIDQSKFGYRMDQVVTVRVSRLLPQHQSFGTILRPVFQFMRFFVCRPDRYCTILRAFEPSRFPQILCGFAQFFEIFFLEMEKRYVESSDTGLPPSSCEATAILNRLAEFCFTGDPTVLRHAVLEALETLLSIETSGWPFFSRNLLDLRDGMGVLHMKKWPFLKDPLEVSLKPPILLHVADLGFHFGWRVAADQHSQMWLQNWKCPVDVKFLRKAFRDIWIPEMVAAVAQRVRFQLNRASTLGRLNAAQMQDAETISTTLLSWESEEDPFNSEYVSHINQSRKQVAALANVFHRQYNRLFGSNSIRELSKVTYSQSSRQKFAQRLFDTLSDSNTLSVSTKYGSWLGMFRHIVHTTMDPFRCVELIETALAAVNIMWVPLLDGSPTLTVANLMVQTTVTPVSSNACPMKRSAAQAEMVLSTHHEPPRKRIINFDGQHEFETMPLLLKQGFEACIQEYTEKKPEVARHFEVVLDLITRNTGQEKTPYSLMLMLVMTLSGSSSTPWMKPPERNEISVSGVNDIIDISLPGFDLLSLQKEQSKFGVALATKMMWFLEPAVFIEPEKAGAKKVQTEEKPFSSTHSMKRILVKRRAWVDRLGLGSELRS